MLTELEIFAVKQSFLIASVSVLLVLPAVILTAWFLVRFTFPGKILVETLVLFPLVLPPVVTGYLLLVLLKRDGIIGGLFHNLLGLELAFTPLAAAVASSVIIFPLVLRPIKISMESLDSSLINVSRGLGRGRFYTFFRVVLPLCLPGIIAGAVLGFARSLGEFGATIMVAGNVPFRTTTVPLAIFSFFNQIEGEGPVFRLVLISLILSFLALVLSEYFLRKQKHA